MKLAGWQPFGNFDTNRIVRDCDCWAWRRYALYGRTCRFDVKMCSHEPADGSFDGVVEL